MLNRQTGVTLDWQTTFTSTLGLTHHMLLDFSVVDVYSIRPTNLKMYQMVKHVVNSKAKVYSNLQDVTNFVVFSQ